MAVNMQPSVLASRADILLADGGHTPAEADFLNRLTSCLGIAADQARRIPEALVIKNRLVGVQQLLCMPVHCGS